MGLRTLSASPFGSRGIAHCSSETPYPGIWLASKSSMLLVHGENQVILGSWCAKKSVQSTLLSGIPSTLHSAVPKTPRVHPSAAPCLGTPRAPAARQAPASPPASSCCLPQPRQRLRGFLSCLEQPEPPALLGAFGGTQEQEEPAPPRERSGRLSPGFRSPLSTPTPPRSFPRAICQVPARWNFTLLF